MVLCVRRVLGFWPLGVRGYLGFGEDQSEEASFRGK